MVSAILLSNTLVISFAVPTNLASMTPLTPCSRLLQHTHTLFGSSGGVCRWRDASTLVIQLGYDAGVRPGSLVKLLGNVIKTQDRTSTAPRQIVRVDLPSDEKLLIAPYLTINVSIPISILLLYLYLSISISISISHSKGEIEIFFFVTYLGIYLPISNRVLLPLVPVLLSNWMPARVSLLPRKP